MLIYQVFPISCDCYLPCLVHSGEVSVKYHMILGVNAHSSDIVLMSLSLHTIVDVPGITHPLPLVSTWEVLPALPSGRLLTLIWGNLRCGIILVRYVTLHHKTSVLVFSHTFPYQGCYTSVIVPLTRRSAEWWQQPMDTVWCHTVE